jgi:hypothetical protein
LDRPLLALEDQRSDVLDIYRFSTIGSKALPQVLQNRAPDVSLSPQSGQVTRNTISEYRVPPLRRLVRPLPPPLSVG